ncbi:hypothetical protein DL546_008328 [Coniochaeta pulveracea]|nr:hypothetical protein DL546_008328 [Coniochaeta pulveracea]
MNWVALAPETNSICATGMRQSPINMVDGVFHMVPSSDIKLEIPDFTEGAEFENLGTTVEVVAKGGSLQLSEANYTLRQFHFHLPSEHLDNGTSIAMEMHMVFETAEKDIAVIGVFIDLDNGGSPATEDPIATPTPTAAAKRRGFHLRRQESSIAPSPTGSFGGVQGFLTVPMIKAPGITSPVLETVFSKVGEIKTPGTRTSTPPLAMGSVVQAIMGGSFQSYSGSLTTPPCKEGVRWFVATQKLQISTATFESVRSVIGFNARYPQNTPGQPNMLQLARAQV